MKLSMSFGALAPPLAEQLPDGAKIKRTDLIHFQKDADAITRLFVRGYLSDAGTSGARKRLMQKILSSTTIKPVLP